MTTNAGTAETAEHAEGISSSAISARTKTNATTKTRRCTKKHEEGFVQGILLRDLRRPSCLRGLVAVLAVVPAMMAAPAWAATKAIRAGKAIDPAGKVITNAVIVVDGDRITSVGTGAAPADAELIDLRRYRIIPGMIDVHTHMTYFWDRALHSWILSFGPFARVVAPEGLAREIAEQLAEATARYAS